MSLTRGLARLGGVAGVLVSLLLLGLVASSSAAHAQNPPFTAYGAGANAVTAGDTIGAHIDGVSCGTATANSSGEWVLAISETAACSPVSGDTVTFSLNGSAVGGTETWSAGGVPTDVAEGVSLTAAAVVAPAAAPAAAPAPPDTGNAGLMAEQGGSTWLLLSLGALVLATVAGARVVTGRVR